MGLYSRYILPPAIDMACGLSLITKQRRKVVPLAEGVVLEIGIGSGLNLPHYDAGKVAKVIGVDPDPHIWKRAAKRLAQAPFPVERIGLSGEQIPLEDKSADTVLVTFSLCSIPDPVAALEEMRRILKPGGRMLFLEHGQAPDARVRRWQHRIDPVWRKIAGGCHSGRPIPKLIERAGWTLDRMEQGYIPGPKVLAYNYWGAAKVM